MKHMKTFFILGILVALVPYLGFPSSWKGVILAILGLTIATLSFRLSSMSDGFRTLRNTQKSFTPSSSHTTETAVGHE